MGKTWSSPLSQNQLSGRLTMGTKDRGNRVQADDTRDRKSSVMSPILNKLQGKMKV
jgi:hypothetical protein